MLRRILLASAGAMALAGPAFAAEPLPPPPPPPPPPPMWTGFYIGLNAGGTWSSSTSVDTFDVPVFAAPTFSTELALSSTFARNIIRVNSGGFIGGGQVGYNYQFGPNWLAGIEADIQGVVENHGTGSVFESGQPVGFPTELIASTDTATKRLDYLGTVRGRLGWLVTPTLLLYGDGGFAYGGVNASVHILQEDFDTLPSDFSAPYSSFASVSTTRVGWTAGGGVEWMFLPNWSLKVEYLYYDLGSVSFALSPLLNRFTTTGAPVWNSFPSASTRFNGNIVRAGINYHFNWAPAPVVAKY
jgi:outer membrane immunogenic protein